MSEEELDLTADRKKDQAEFDAAFEEDEQVPQDLEVDPSVAPVKPDETKETPLETPVVDDPLSLATDTTPVEQEPVVPPEKTLAEVEAELAREKMKTSTWEGRIKAANDAKEKAEAEAEALRQAKDKKAQEADTLPDDDEAKSISEFLEEFPDLHKPIVALVKRDLLPMIGQMIDDRLGKLKDVLPEVESIKENMQTDKTAAHFRSITKVHADWKQIVESGALDKWIESKPSYIQDALNKVKDQGATQEVVDMFSQYKQDTGQVPAKNNPDHTDATTKADDLLAVPSTPNPIKTDKAKKDKDDYDSAWDEAVKKD